MTGPAHAAGADMAALVSGIRTAAAEASVDTRGGRGLSAAARDYNAAVDDEGDVLVALVQAVAAGAPDAELGDIRTLLTAVLDRRDAAARRLGIAASGLPPDAARLPGPGGAR